MLADDQRPTADDQRRFLMHSQSEDRQIQRDQHSTYEYRHHHQNQWFNQRHGRAQRRLHIFFVELRDRVQHGRQRARRFAHFNHLNRQLRKNSLFFQTSRQSLPFAHSRPCAHNPFYDAAARHGSSRRFHRRDQRQSALQQRRQHARKARHL